jgi:hypothetical protein
MAISTIIVRKALGVVSRVETTTALPFEENEGIGNFSILGFQNMCRGFSLP